MTYAHNPAALGSLPSQRDHVQLGSGDILNTDDDRRRRLSPERAPVWVLGIVFLTVIAFVSVLAQ